MSRLLVRKAFELMEDELKSRNLDPTLKHQTKKAKSHSKDNHENQKISNTGSINWRINSKTKLQTGLDKIDRTEENLYALKQLSKLKPKPAASQKVIDYHRKVLSKRYIELVEEIPEPESILFPEENKKKKRKK